MSQISQVLTNTLILMEHLEIVLVLLEGFKLHNVHVKNYMHIVLVMFFIAHYILSIITRKY